MATKQYQAPLPSSSTSNSSSSQSVSTTESYKYSTAVTLRLCKEYFGTGRLVCGDSAFSSVETALALIRKGLYYTGIVKTIRSMFPKDEFDKRFAQKPSPNLGSHIVLQSVEEDILLIALAWKDYSLRQFISTAGITVPLNNVEHTYTKKETVEDELGEEVVIDQSYVVKYAWPSLVEHYHEGIGAIDLNNRYRQGNLKIEERWKTQNWPVRNFSTNFGIILTNAFLLWKYDRRRRQ